MTMTMTEAREAFDDNPTRETYGDYYEIAIAEWREARDNGWYHSKVAAEQHLIYLGFAAEKYGFDVAAVAKERGLVKSHKVADERRE